MNSKHNYNPDPSTTFINGPVVIGGVGGSGTRVVYQLLHRLGFYMGTDLNSAGDNLWFTVLFKRPHWFNSIAQNNPEQMDRAFELFEKLMTQNHSLTFTEALYYWRAACQLKKLKQRTLRQVFHRFRKACQRPKVDFHQYTGWGWKEPNSMIYIQHLSRYFKKMKFILVIRHGLDMAYSERQQFRHWAGFFGLDRLSGWKEWPLAKQKLEYWLTANRFIIEQGGCLSSDRFMCLHLEDLCDYPHQEIPRLLDFLDINLENRAIPVDIDELYRIPKSPHSRGRYKKTSLNQFSTNQLEAVTQMGFKIDSEIDK